MPKTKDAKKRKSKPLNHNHNHNGVHIHIGNKKTKSSRRRRAPAGPHIGAVITMHATHAAPPGYAQPAYAFPTNRPQFFDPTTQVDRERNQLMPNAPMFSLQVPTQGTGFRPIPAEETPSPRSVASTPPLTEREMHPPMPDTYGPPRHTPFAYKSDASWLSPRLFSN